MIQVALLMFAIVVIMLMLNVPISLSLIVASITAVLISDITTPVMIVQRMFTALDSFSLLAVPFFILSGDLMTNGGISDKLIDFIKILLKKVPAGLSIITTVASGFFGALSGSNPATVAAIGGIMIPEMEKSGYSKEKAAAVAASSGTLGVIIPPSISMVTYCVISGVSIGTIFMAGLIPGLLLALSIILVHLVLNRNDEVKSSEKVTFKIVWKAFVKAVPALIMPMIILGGIYSGVFTPTESAAVAVVYSVFVGLFVYKEVTIKELPSILLKSAKSTALVEIIVACSASFTWFMTAANLPTLISTSILSVLSSKIIIILMVNAILLFLGMFLETQSIILLMVPILFPLLTSLGVDPIVIGIMIVINTSIGMITPPMAVNLYVASGIAKTGIADISKAIIPYLAIELVVLLLISFIPQITLFLPNLLGV